jgi:uncharacterized iron-regulated protein
MTKKVLFLLGFSVLLPCAIGSAADSVLDLPIGDPARRERIAPLVLDGVTDTRSGEALTPREVAARLTGVRLLFVGESHTDIEYHNAQLKIVEELVRAGRKVMIGLEMFPYTEQPALDQWNSGTLSEERFLEVARWYTNWGYHWHYYREIFLLARAHKVPVFGVNTPREIVGAVRRKGLDKLTPEEAAHIPARIDTDNAEHLRLFKAFFAEEGGMHSAGMGDDMWKMMFAAQCTWDATMGYNAVQALAKHGDPQTIMVVLIGSGHVAYGLGAERQARLWFDGTIASLIPVAVVDEKDRRTVVRASYADFLWGLPKPTDPLYPSLGFSTPQQKQGEHYPVINVEKGSVAERAGLTVGDVLIAVDGVEIKEKGVVNRLMSDKRWGDTVELKIRRGETEQVLVAKLRRTLPVADGGKVGAPPAAIAPGEAKK